MMSATNFFKYLCVSFSQSILIFFLILVIQFLLLFLFSHMHATFVYVGFHSYILTIYVILCIRCSNSFSFIVNSLMLSMWLWKLICSSVLWRLYPPVYLYKMKLSGIITITNGNGDNESILKTLLLLPTPEKIFLLRLIPLYCFLWLSWWTFWICKIFCAFSIVDYPVLWDHIVCLSVVNPCNGYIFPLCFALLGLCIVDHLFFSSPFAILFVLQKQSTVYL